MHNTQLNKFNKFINNCKPLILMIFGVILMIFELHYTFNQQSLFSTGWNADLNQYSISRIMPYAFARIFQIIKILFNNASFILPFLCFLYAIAPTFNNWLYLALLLILIPTSLLIDTGLISIMIEYFLHKFHLIKLINPLTCAIFALLFVFIAFKAFNVNLISFFINKTLGKSTLRPLWNKRTINTNTFSMEHSSKIDIEPTVRIKKQPIISRSDQLPSFNLLHAPTSSAAISWDKAKVQAQLEQVLTEFGIKGKIIRSSVGPIVTLYELEPEPGIKAQRIINLATDIARSMSVQSTRIAPILDKGVIGIELANPKREMVYLSQLIDDPSYTSSQQLMLILGCDIGKKVVVADLAQMPHMLMAGTTGSGKSVVIHTLLLSLLFKHTPASCKLLLIDPKMLELSSYANIPHLLAPVITDSKMAVVGLKWAVQEMERRYRLMSDLGVRNLSAYNAKTDQEKLPFIVVIVDEFADLMSVSGKEIETLIQRLAQMARAAGMHVILATQRPSVDVITGTIKANFPTRLALQVATRIDARTVLGDHTGAEQLLGKGDMLYLNGAKLQRIHGPYVSEDEVEKVVDFWRSQAEPNYINLEEESLSMDSALDDLTGQVWEFIQRTKRVSASSVQRQFNIGFNRAAKCLEILEQMGKISEQDSMGRRKIR